MFSKTSNKAKTFGNGSKNADVTRSVPSILSADMRVKGNLISEGEIQIDGAIDGDIRTKILLVGLSAEVKGEIVAETVQIHGTVHGQIKAKVVVLAKTAHVVGDILHEDLSIDKGAFLEGHCRSIIYAAPQKEPLNVVAKMPGDAGVVSVGIDVKSGTEAGQLSYQQPKKTIGA
jgi:cytoskeletal protein CcmA (bactofilin family)